MTLESLPGTLKVTADVTSAGIAVGTIAQLLPHIAAILTIIWTLIRIYETDTVQGFLHSCARRFAPAADQSTNREHHDG